VFPPTAVASVKQEIAALLARAREPQLARTCTLPCPRGSTVLRQLLKSGIRSGIARGSFASGVAGSDEQCLGTAHPAVEMLQSALARRGSPGVEVTPTFG